MDLLLRVLYIMYKNTIVSVCSVKCARSYCIRDNSVYVPSQWEMALHCNAISHWLGAYIEWSLLVCCSILLCPCITWVSGYNGGDWYPIGLATSQWTNVLSIIIIAMPWWIWWIYQWWMSKRVALLPTSPEQNLFKYFIYMVQISYSLEYSHSAVRMVVTAGLVPIWHQAIWSYHEDICHLVLIRTFRALIKFTEAYLLALFRRVTNALSLPLKVKFLCRSQLELKVTILLWNCSVHVMSY